MQRNALIRPLPFAHCLHIWLAANLPSCLSIVYTSSNLMSCGGLPRMLCTEKGCLELITHPRPCKTTGG